MKSAVVMGFLILVGIGDAGARHLPGGAAAGQGRQASIPLEQCWAMAANAYRIDPALLQAIVKVESRGNPNARACNPNGTCDIGLAQINSSWLPTLARHGVTERDLYDPCVNLHVGAWILANNFRRHGVTWAAVGKYNAASPQKGTRYAWAVYRALPTRPANEPTPARVASSSNPAGEMDERERMICGYGCN